VKEAIALMAGYFAGILLFVVLLVLFFPVEPK
jgi:hypothetical protein